MNFSKHPLDDVADSGATYHPVKLGPVRTNDQESGVKLQPIAGNQSAVVFLLHEGQRFGQADVVFEEVVDELLRFEARAALLFGEENGVGSRNRHSQLA